MELAFIAGTENTFLMMLTISTVPPGNAEHLEQPYSLCDPYSNPQPQEILQILPHQQGKYGYPTKKGQGWMGDSRSRELDVGRLSSLFISTRIHALNQWRDIGHL
ncbi:hypothetical protein ACH5RR_016036 [Cinchona calisaya]|uniref:DUF7705 domain-containing protein n=1 Tax=Cinchona calisaya TaxID=153742 RepID=A0ABD2ZYG8_9GENT